MNIGQRVRYFRDLFGISGKSLAEKVGLDPSQISKIENGSSKPSLDALERICEVLGITTSEFFAENQKHKHIPSDIGQFAIDEKNHSLIRLIQAMHGHGYPSEIIESWINTLNTSLEAIEKKLAENYIIIPGQPQGKAVWVKDDFVPDDLLTVEEKEILEKLRQKIQDPNFKPPGE